MKKFQFPGIEPTPVEYRPCIVPLGYAALLLANFKFDPIANATSSGPEKMSIFFSEQKKLHELFTWIFRLYVKCYVFESGL